MAGWSSLSLSRSPVCLRLPFRPHGARATGETESGHLATRDAQQADGDLRHRGLSCVRNCGKRD